MFFCFLLFGCELIGHNSQRLHHLSLLQRPALSSRHWPAVSHQSLSKALLLMRRKLSPQKDTGTQGGPRRTWRRIYIFVENGRSRTNDTKHWIREVQRQENQRIKGSALYHWPMQGDAKTGDFYKLVKLWSEEPISSQTLLSPWEIGRL